MASVRGVRVGGYPTENTGPFNGLENSQAANVALSHDA